MQTSAFTSGFLSQIDHYVQCAKEYTKFAKSAQANDPLVQDVWFDPEENSIILRRLHSREEGNNKTKIKIAAANTQVQDHYCGLALCNTLQYFHEAKNIAERMMGFLPKLAGDSSTLKQKAYSLLGWDDRYYRTNPVAAMLATGILGAGLGYGGASLFSPLLPSIGGENWDKKKFRRSGALLGAAAGMVPGGIEAAQSLLIGQSPFDGSHMKRSYKQQHAYKNAALPEPRISGEELMRMTWEHPLVSKQMSPGQQALLSGAVHGAAQVAGSPFFTPRDMARLTAGLGSGYGMGLVAGKILGAVTGLPKPAQNTLANTGALAGALKATLPLIYGGK